MAIHNFMLSIAPITSITITQTTLCSEHSLNHEQILRTPKHNVGRGVKNHAIYWISVVMQSKRKLLCCYLNVYEPHSMIYKSNAKDDTRHHNCHQIRTYKLWGLYCHLYTDMERSCHVQSAMVNFYSTETKLR